MKASQELITFLSEDFVEVGLQFFYFEKYSFMPNDTIVYINAFFMIYKALELTVRMIIRMKEIFYDRYEYIRKESFWKVFWKIFNFEGLLGRILNLKLKQETRATWTVFFFGIVCLNTYPISRAAGAMYQSARGNAIIRVSYI